MIEIIDEKEKTAIVGANIVAMPGSDETARARSRAQRVVTDDRGSATLPRGLPHTPRHGGIGDGESSRIEVRGRVL